MLWLASISGQALNHRLGKRLKRTTVKQAQHVVDALSGWLEQQKHMDKHGSGFKLSIPIKVASMKTRLSQFHDRCENMYNRLVEAVRE